MAERAESSESGVEIAPGVRVAEGVLEFTFTSGSGPGGQNVNKRATRAQLRVRVEDIPIAARARERLGRLASHWLTEDGALVIAAGEHRSQAQNRAECLERLRALIVAARVVPKVRVGTRPTRGSVERRIEEKKRRSGMKRLRKDVE